MVRASDVSTALFTAFCSDLHLPDLAERNRFDVWPNGLSMGFGAEQYRIRAAIGALFKKTQVEEAPDALTKTLEDFCRANDACSEKTPKGFRTQDVSIAAGLSISYARNYLWGWFEKQNEPAPAITQASIEVAARFGPGRSVGLGRQPSLFYFKVGDARMTASSEFVRSWYETSVLHNPLCEAAEMARHARWGRAEVGIAGHLTFVPKKYARKRIVVTEPTINTFFQLGLGEEVARVLRLNTGIDFSTQEDVNKSLAHLGSLYGTFGTMDMTQASDYLSLALIEFMYPPSLVRWFKILRTGVVQLDSGEEIPLHMASTMGNGFTFPMMTTLLTAVVFGVYKTLDILPIRSYEGGLPNFGVYGDDIIVVRKAFDLVAEVCSNLGLVVNGDKSFNCGPFRESCGADYYKGIDVRPVFLTRYTKEHDLLSCFNRLAVWAFKYQLNLSGTLHTIGGFLNKASLHLVPPDRADTAGIKSPYPVESPTKVEDWICLWEFDELVPMLNNISFEPWDMYQAGEYTCSEMRRKRFRAWLRQLRSVCSGSINEPALLKALLHGSVQRGKTTPRIEASKMQFRRVSAVSPRWGYDGGMASEKLDDAERLWWQLLVVSVLGALNS